MGNIEWNITKCRAKYKKHKEANYTFWIVDYFREEDIVSTSDVDDWAFLDKDIFDFRNEGIVKTKYFKKEKEATEFIDSLIKGESNLSEIEKIKL